MTEIIVAAAVAVGAWITFRMLRAADADTPLDVLSIEPDEAPPVRYRWITHLSLDTPLWALERHGEVWTGAGAPPQEAGREHGLWRGESGDVDTVPPGRLSGPPPLGLSTDPATLGILLAYLREFRRIVEGPEVVGQQVAQIRALADAGPDFARVAEALGDDFPVSWFAARFTRIHGVGSGTARAFFDAGFQTLEDLAHASDRELQSIHGVGPSLVKQIRDQLPALTEEAEDPEPPPLRDPSDEPDVLLEDERESLRERLGEEPSEFEVQWSLLETEREQFLKSGMQREAMRTRIQMAELQEADGQGETALTIYLEVCVHDVAHSPGMTGTEISDRAGRAARRLVQELALDVDDVDEILSLVRERESRTLPAWAEFGERWDALSLALLEDAAQQTRQGDEDSDESE
ncbi:MAG: helix-hairpin-helix domain-containing protein [Gemmatimonadales bacterium]|nr:MAG: helix-hairpin-helix domain-containing protein [Gemmatimonadales bacterium]